jgi:hypothetical protein
MTDMPIVELRDAGAFAHYQELGVLLGGRINGVTNLRQLLNEGLRLFRSKAEGLTAGSAPRHIVSLHPSDSLLEILAAIREGDAELGEFVLAFRGLRHHRPSPSLIGKILSGETC